MASPVLPAVSPPILLPPFRLEFYADVTTIVHNLIRDMKALEAVLHRWSCAQATPKNVSSAYVQFGIEFNAVVHAFEGYNIPTGDLHPIPTQLRSVVQECLEDVPSPDTLDRYLPEIQRVLGELLHGLKAKHPVWRSAVARPPTSNRAYSPGGPHFPQGRFP